jgi:hypothetical protein
MFNPFTMWNFPPEEVMGKEKMIPAGTLY